MTLSYSTMTAKSALPRPSAEDAREAVRVLLRYIGETPEREGLRDTPDRVVRAYEEFFAGYGADPARELGRTFEDIAGYDDMVLVRDIDFTSHCEHHMVPIIGRAHVAYWPAARVVGISKLGRVVDLFARRLVSQETLTRQILECIDSTLKPKGVAVLITANHQCMSTRGVSKRNASTVTSLFSGLFQDDMKIQERFLRMVMLDGASL